jgi:hypothetical protein
MSRHHAHTGDLLVMVVSSLVVIVCAAVVISGLARLLGGAA